MSRAAVIGAVNIDICGRPFNPLIMRDSNPGTVTMSMGGVGRNIAHNLRLLGLDVTFITALGGDMYAKSVDGKLLSLGFDMSLARSVPGREHLVVPLHHRLRRGHGAGPFRHGRGRYPERRNIWRCLASINSADAAVIDGNLTDESIRFIAKTAPLPLYADPVSVTKAERLRPILSRLAAFKPNEIEAMHLTGTQNAGGRRQRRWWTPAWAGLS
jgi:pseudouridine kinase